MATESRIVVNKADDGRGWALRQQAGGPALATYRTKEEALERAEEELRARPRGGELLSYNSRTRELESRRVAPRAETRSDVQGPVPAEPPREGFSGLTERLDREGESIDRWLEIVLLLAASFGAAVVSPEVADASGWLAVFVATLAWSLGWALATYLVSSGALQGVQTIFAVGLSFVASITIATFLGVGVLEAPPLSTGSPSGVVDWLAAVATTAVLTYGWFGALVGALVGFWLGYRFAEHLG